MSLGSYYRRLGLPITATSDDVRKRFRKLAMQYHPDKNPSPSAAKKFLVITEAYEIICGKRPNPILPRKSASNRSQPPATNEKSAAREHEKRVREAKERYETQQEQENIENERYYKKLTGGMSWKIMRISAVLGALMAFGLLLDQFLPHHFEEDKVSHYALNQGLTTVGDEIISVIKTEQGAYHWVSRINYALYGRAPSITVEKSWIFHQPIHVIANDKTQNLYYEVHYTLFSNFVLFIIVLLFPIFALKYKRRTVGFTIVYHVSYYGVNGLMLFVLFTDDRWAHFLSLGFF
ncbi:MAG: hypothetical protein ACI865_000937 [Flavobacteriaceae bacterium]